MANGRVYVGMGSDVYCFGPMIFLNFEITPLFFDNNNNQIFPSSWDIQFPNETLLSVSSTSSFIGPIGRYLIRNVNWNGVIVPLREPVSFFLGSDSVWEPKVNCTLPTNLSLSSSSSTLMVGYKVTIHGILKCNDVGIIAAPILLSYSVTDGATWNEITQVYTSAEGNYSAIWIPSATGNFILKAGWEGNSTYPRAINTTVLSSIAYDDQYVFSVESNSTISELAFNTNNWKLSFEATGPEGTTGYIRVTVAKSLVADVANIRVFMDGKENNFTITSLDGSWLLYFTYSHSTHQVEVDLDTTIIPEFSTIVLFITLIITTAAIIICRRGFALSLNNKE